MQLEIAYTNHKGKRIAFGGENPALHYFANNVRDWLWSYAVRNGRVSAFTHDVKELTFKVGIFAETEEEGLALRDAIYEITDTDVMNRRQGKLSVGDWAMYCYIIGGTIDQWWFSGQVCEMELTILSERPYWVKESLTKYYAENESQSTAEFLDCPYDFPFDYTRERVTATLKSDAIADSDFLMRIYGPCVDPYVIVSGNNYEVDITVPDGSRLEIDSAQQTIIMIDEVGNEMNAYDARKLGKRGGGNYIFERIPMGFQYVVWSHDFDFDLVVYEERGVPAWVS